jgi:predicted DNA-binding protein
METTPFDLTPEQKSLLAALAQETGKPIPALIAEALDELQEHVHAAHAQHPGNGGQEKQASAVPSPSPRKKHIWEVAAELVAEIPEEDLARLPVDGAAQHDHYLYGTPKRTR